MSYELQLSFDPAVDTESFLAYFAQRRHYTSDKDQLAYRNADTGVSFVIRHQSKKSLFGKGKTSAAQFEINYGRPRFFATEAEIELSALVARFSPQIADPQMEGMDMGPYSAAAFLKGWNFGNRFAIEKVIASNPGGKNIPTLPAERLQTVWAWNYQRAERLDRGGDRQFVPKVTLVAQGEKLCLATVWALGMPILLPKVDLVLVGRNEGGAKKVGLSPWSEVAQILTAVGIDTGHDPVDIMYAITPEPLAQWIATRPAFDPQSLPQLPFDVVLDDDLVSKAGG